MKLLNRSPRSGFFLLVSLAYLALGSGSALAGDPYLDALNQEVSSEAYVAEAEQEAQMMQRDANNVQALGENKVAAQNIKNFENLLIKKYPSTFQIYLKLDDEEKGRVFKRFRNSEKLNEASKMILQAYLQ